MAKTVVVFGKGDLAIQIAHFFNDSSDWRLLAVIPDLPEPSWTGSLTSWAIENNVRVLGSGLISELEDRDIDLGFSCFYGKILKPNDLKKFQLTLNLHNAPLPKYRGVNPINWALKNEELVHGVTIHEITPGIDDGPIYGQVLFDIDPQSEDVEDVYTRALHFGYCLFLDTIGRIEVIKPRIQDELNSTYYARSDFPKLEERKGWRISTLN